MSDDSTQSQSSRGDQSNESNETDAMARGRSDATRRSVLKRTTALGVGLAGLGTGAAASASAQTDASVELLDRPASRKVVARARGTTAFRELASHLRSEYGYVVPASDVTVAAAADPEGTDHHVVAFTARATGRADATDRSADLVLALRGSEVAAGGASVVDYDGDVPRSVAIAEYVDGELEETAHELDIEGLSAPDAAVEDGQFTTQQTDCEICTSLFDVACTVGCGIGGLALCTLAGITTFGVASIACGAIGSAVCYFVGEYGCDPGAETACEQLNYC